MKHPVCITLLLIATFLFVPVASAQTSRSLRDAKEMDRFATNECFSKGGLGIIGESLYIALRSPENELLWSGRDKWVGHDASIPEVVIVFEGKIFPVRELPDNFDLSRTTVVSFERDKVRFFDFKKMSGGYYRRHRE